MVVLGARTRDDGSSVGLGAGELADEEVGDDVAHLVRRMLRAVEADRRVAAGVVEDGVAAYVLLDVVGDVVHLAVDDDPAVIALVVFGNLLCSEGLEVCVCERACVRWRWFDGARERAGERERGTFLVGFFEAEEAGVFLLAALVASGSSASSFRYKKPR